MEKDLIVGIHSIQAALENPKRTDFELFMTKEGHKSLAATLKKIQGASENLLSKHEFQERAKRLYQKFNFQYQRVPGGAVLLCSPMAILSPAHLYATCRDKERLKIVILDGVTDIHNAGAIIRTASFYGADSVVIGGKFSTGRGPSFFRVASGGVEHLDLIQAGNLPRLVGKLQELGVSVFALCEDGQEELSRTDSLQVAIVVGDEGHGISHALLKQCTNRYAIRPYGRAQSLNASVAAAIGMERLFCP